MATRNPKLEPLPGDTFQTSSGSVYVIIDRFISGETKPGSGNSGYFHETRLPDGRVTYGTSSRGVFRNKVRKATLLSRSKLRKTNWDNVPRHPHATVCFEMKRKHGGRIPTAT